MAQEDLTDSIFQCVGLNLTIMIFAVFNYIWRLLFSFSLQPFQKCYKAPPCCSILKLQREIIWNLTVTFHSLGSHGIRGHWRHTHSCSVDRTHSHNVAGAHLQACYLGNMQESRGAMIVGMGVLIISLVKCARYSNCHINSVSKTAAGH